MNALWCLDKAVKGWIIFRVWDRFSAKAGQPT